MNIVIDAQQIVVNKNNMNLKTVVKQKSRKTNEFHLFHSSRFCSIEALAEISYCIWRPSYILEYPS
jgi:hypothetical protein